MIVDGVILEGQKFPNQNDLAKQLGVSRSSLREALHTLTVIGVIEQKPGVGTQLKTSVPLMLMDTLEQPALPEEQASMELLEVRRLAESNMVPLAVLRGTDREIEELEKLILRMEQAMRRENLAAYVSLDLLFHNTLAKMSHNRYYQFIFTGLQQHLTDFLAASFQLEDILLGNSIAGHRMMFEAAKSRDEDKASVAINTHLDQMEAGVRNYFRSL